MTVESPDAAAPGAPADGPDRPATTVGDALRWVVVAACVGSSVLHFANAPAHIDEDGLHGAFFLAVAWGQLGAGVALARWRAARWPWLATAVLNAGVIGVWVLSRTAGVPGSDAEPVGFPDALATGFEAVAVVGAVLALRPALAARPSGRVHPAFAGVGLAAVIALVSVALMPSVAGDHDHGPETAEGESAAGGHDHGDVQPVAAVDADERCDLGFNTAAFNAATRPGVPHAHDDTGGVDFTLEEWAEVFVDPDKGLPVDVVVDFIEQRPVFREGILSGALTHTLEPDPWNPMTDPDECDALADELRRAKEVAAQYPTVADAEAAGYRKVTGYYPGIAAHYMKFEYLRDGFVLEQPEMLLYDGDGPTAGIVGLSYYILHEGESEPEDGFTGDNDHYHRHVGLCFKDGVVAAGSSTSEEDCEALGGTKRDGSAGWMSHVWITPGCESDWGVFSGANPILTVRVPGDTSAVPSGCGTGRTMADDLAFDDSGNGPRV